MGGTSPVPPDVYYIESNSFHRSSSSSSLAVVSSSLLSSDSKFLSIISSSLNEADMAYSWFSKWSISSDKLVAAGYGLGSCKGSVDSNGIMMGSGW